MHQGQQGQQAQTSSQSHLPPPLPQQFVQQQPLLQGPPQPVYQTQPVIMSGQAHTSIYLGDPRFNGFDHKTIRSQFIAKVYTILGVQLLFTTAIIGWFTLHQPTKDYFNQYGDPWLFSAMGLGIVVFIILVCVESARRTFPLNFGLLCLLTLAYTMMAAIMSARYDTVTVMVAVGTTAFATLAIILLAKYSPFDMTTCGCGLCVLALIHLLASLMLTLILVPMGYGHTASMLLAGFGAFLISAYMMFDLQLIMGGRNQELSPEEYILAAALLYIDIVQLFQYMLILFGDRN